MLDALRKGAGGWFAQLLIAILVVGFAFWGVTARGTFSGFHADRLALVGGTEISLRDFQRQYDLATRRLSAQFRQQITPQQAQMIGLPGQVLGRLISEATLDDAASSLGLGISNKALMAKLMAEPSFQGPNGQFSRSYLLQLISSNGMTEDQFVSQQREAYVRQQLADALVGGFTVPDIYMQAVHEYRTDTRNVSYLVLTPALAGDVGEPSESDLKAYFDKHKATWKAPEYRAVSFFTLSPAAMAQTKDVSDADVRQYYDSHLARYTKPEQREVQQIVFKSEEKASAAAAELSAGKTFADLVTSRNLKPADVDLGLVTRDKIVDPTVADAAFSLAADGTSGVVKGRFGPVIVHVVKIDPEVVTPFEQVKDKIREEIATNKAAGEINDIRNAIEDARAGGSTLQEVAGQYGLKVVTVAAVDQSGKGEDGKAVADLPAAKDFLSQVFQTDVGLDNPPVQMGRDSFIWYEVTAITPAHDRQLDEVKDKVIAAWKKDETQKKLDAKANDVRERLANGEDIAKVADALSVKVNAVDSITRATKPTGDLSADAIKKAFDGPKGFVGVAPGAADGSKIVLEVTDVTVPDYFAGRPETKQTEQDLARQIADDMLQEYVAEEQNQLGVQVNQAAFRQAIAAGS